MNYVSPLTSIASHLPAELLSNILENSDPTIQLASSTVCRVWSNTALDLIWEHLDSILPLLAILGDLEYSDNGWTLVSSVLDVDWVRYGRHARRIRSMHYNEARLNPRFDGRDSRISPELFVILSRRSDGALLPQLRELRWRSHSEEAWYHVTFFVGGRLHSLVLDLLQYGSGAVCKLLQNVAELSNTKLLSFEIQWLESRTPDHDAQNFGRSLSDFLRIHRRLRKLKIKAWKLPSFYAPELSNFSDLVEVYWTIAANDQDMLNTTLQPLATGCPSLEQLSILLNSPNGTKFAATFVRTLFGCRKLKSFRILGATVHGFTAQEIHSMGAAWPRMVRLDLRTHCDVGLLASFGTSGFGSTLQKLSIDCVVSKELPTCVGMAIRLPALRVLEVGSRPLRKERVQDVAEFLGKICPPDMVIRQRAHEGSMWGVCPNWTEAVGMLQMVHRVRAHCYREILDSQEDPTGI